MMKYLILMLLLSAGCISITNREKSQLEIRPPESAAFWRARSMNGDCNDKAKYYAVALAEAGYKPVLVVIDLHDSNDMHTIVMLSYNRAYDPSFGRTAVGHEEWGRYIMTIR